MKIVVDQQGGLAAAALRGRAPRVLDTETLPPAATQELAGLVEAARTEHAARPASAPARRAPDAMSYRITVQDAGVETVLRCSDADMPDAFADLLDAVKRHLR